MGRMIADVYDPDELEMTDDDMEMAGIDEAYETYQEYYAYMPDEMTDIAPIGDKALAACERAERAIEVARGRLSFSNVAEPTTWLLLYDEAVSTTQAENYPVTCESMLEYAATSMSGRVLSRRQAESAAMDAVEALKDFVDSRSSRTTLDDICRVNEVFGQTSPRAELCGTLRDRPVFIGRSLFDAEFVPPPADYVEDYMNDLVRFMNTDQKMSPVAKAALAHSQFVTIHPFEDGNGRTGRAIAQRVLSQSGLTGDLVLPTTSPIAADKPSYVQAIQDTRTTRGRSDHSAFIDFYARSCEVAARQATVVERRLENTISKWQKAIPTNDRTMQKVLEAFAATPVMTESMLSKATSSDARHAIEDLLSADVIKTRRSRFGNIDVYVAPDSLRVLQDAQYLKRDPISKAQETLSKIEAAALREERDDPKEQPEGPDPKYTKNQRGPETPER